MLVCHRPFSQKLLTILLIIAFPFQGLPFLVELLRIEDDRVVCPSVSQSVGPSIGPFVGPSAGWMHRCLPVRLVIQGNNRLSDSFTGSLGDGIFTCKQKGLGQTDGPTDGHTFKYTKLRDAYTGNGAESKG